MRNLYTFLKNTILYMNCFSKREHPQMSPKGQSNLANFWGQFCKHAHINTERQWCLRPDDYVLLKKCSSYPAQACINIIDYSGSVEAISIIFF